MSADSEAHRFSVILICRDALHAAIGLTASLVSQLFSREICRKSDSLLAKISVRFSREEKNAIYCEACGSQFASLVICETRKQAKL